MSTMLDNLNISLRTINNKGLRLALLDYIDLFENIVQRYKESSKDSSKIKVRWSFKEEIFNAGTTIHKFNRKSITISYSCWYQSQAAANFLMSSTDLYPHIGDISLGTEEDGDTPACPIRFKIACFISEMVLTFILYHELGHLNLGHSFTEKRFLTTRRKKITSQLSSNSSNKYIEKLHLEEFEADLYAFDKINEIFKKKEPLFPFQKENSRLLFKYNKEIAFSTHAIVISLLGGFTNSLTEYEEKSHPHPAVRFASFNFWIKLNEKSESPEKQNRNDYETTDFLTSLLKFFVEQDILDEIFINQSEYLHTKSKELMLKTVSFTE